MPDPEVVASVVVQGGYGATVGETGPEAPDEPIVPGARFYDLVPVRERPYGPAAPSLHQRPTVGSIRLRANLLQKPLALGGASTDEYTPLIAAFGLRTSHSLSRQILFQSASHDTGYC
jgi:hypothetical protein